MLDLTEIAPETARPLKRAEYDKLVDLGVFEDERVELLYGVIVAMSPQGARHADAIRRLATLLLPPLVGKAYVQVQSPFGASDDSEPEPDLAIVPIQKYLEEHPSQAHLVVEMAESSLRKDRRVKGPLYAACGIPEYWIVKVADQTVEVYSDPVTGAYRQVDTYVREEAITLKSFPDLTIRIADFLG